ncbi:MAG: BatA domain-containing protein [Phycisphaerae bacterium]|nr:BatA domain-containing protein [Phycisphaerae bacterium]
MPNLLAITFVHTAILGAAALAVLPIIIHLLMRSKPRLVIFPALRFVKVTHNANVTRNRLKHFLLLMMRMSAIALLALVLARPKVETSGGIGMTAKDPVSAVVIIDTSGSMAYRVAGQPRLEDAKRLAGQLLKELPAHSQVGLLWPDRVGDSVDLVEDIDFCVSQIQDLADRRGEAADPVARPSMRTGQRVTMAPLLARAYKSLEKANFPRREIYVFNDCTRDSWADVGMGAFAANDNVTVYLFDVGSGENQDFLVTEAKWHQQVVSARQWPVLNAAVRCGQLTGKKTLELRIGKETVARAELDLANKLETVKQPLKISPLDEGLHTGLLHLDCKDEILEDNDRYLALDVGPLPAVLMIESQAVGDRGWSVGALVEAMFEGSGLFGMVHMQAGDFLKPATEAADRDRLANSHAVVLADVRVLGEKQWAALENYVSSGGTLITLLGPNTDPAAMSSAAALAVLPAPGIDKLVAPSSPPAPGAPPAPGMTCVYPAFDKNLSRVLDVYRANVGKPQLDRELVYQYYSLPADKPLPAGTVALVRLADPAGSPLLLERQLGSGHSLLLTTTPQGKWSQWSQRETAPAMFYSMLLAYPRGLQRAYHFTMDQQASVTAPNAFRGGSATVTLPDNRGTMKFEINGTTGAVTLPTRWLGYYRVELTAPPPSGARQPILYAVNIDPDEFTLERANVKDLADAFPRNRLMVVSGADQLQAGRGKGPATPKEVGPLIGLALLLLLVGESFFSNRFYRQPVASSAPVPEQAPLAMPVDEPKK